MGFILREVSISGGCRGENEGTYVDGSITDPNAHCNNFDGKNSQVIQYGVTVWDASDAGIGKEL